MWEYIGLVFTCSMCSGINAIIKKCLQNQNSPTGTGRCTTIFAQPQTQQDFRTLGMHAATTTRVITYIREGTELMQVLNTTEELKADDGHDDEGAHGEENQGTQLHKRPKDLPVKNQQQALCLSCLLHGKTS